MHSALRPVSVINPVKMEQGRGRSSATQPHKESGRGGDAKDIHALLCRRRLSIRSSVGAQYLKTKYYESKFAPQWRETERGRVEGSTMQSLMMVKAVQKFHDKINALGSASDRSLEQIRRNRLARE